MYILCSISHYIKYDTFHITHYRHISYFILHIHLGSSVCFEARGGGGGGVAVGGLGLGGSQISDTPRPKSHVFEILVSYDSCPDVTPTSHIKDMT